MSNRNFGLAGVTAFALFVVLLGPGCSCGGEAHPAQQDAAPQQDVAPQEDAQEDAQDDAWVPPDGYVPDGFQQPDGYIPDGGTGVRIEEVVPAAIARAQDNDVEIIGDGFQDGASVTLRNCDTGTEYTFTATVTGFDDGGAGGIATITVPADVAREQGLYTVTIVNPDGSFASLTCALWISAQAPPTVTEVKPASASRGDPADGISSDQLVTIVGTGFQSTPNVRWQELATGDLYDAKIVGFIDGQHLTALCPSESKHMPVGDYHVWVVNPDLLAAEWLVNGTTPGIFKIMALPPPRIETVTPFTFAGADCSSTNMEVTGSGLVPDTGSGGTTFWIVMPAGTTTCTSGTGRYDAQGNWLCPITTTINSATSATISLSPNCPNNGAYPIEAINPDGQAGFYYSIVLTPSSICKFQAAGNTWQDTTGGLKTKRYLLASATGCDEFGHAFIYAAGGLNDTNTAVASVEFSEVDLGGLPGPWHESQQYYDATTPRVINTLGGLVADQQPRAGLTMIRVGRHLYAIGGTATNSIQNPSPNPVTALDTVEHAFILGYETMPMAHTPKVEGTGGLPIGAWYYRVSAIGDFGEGLASDEVVILNEGGTLKVCWTVPPAPTTATAYNIYRTKAADGRSRSEVLLAAGVAGVDSGITGIKCFTDDGFGALTPAPGRLRGAPVTGGSLVAGTYRYRVSATIDDGGGTIRETLGGYEAAIQVTAADVTAGLTSVQLHWDPVQYASAYNLYKWNATDQKFVIFANTANGATLTLTDDGGTPTAACPVSRADTPCAALEGFDPLPFGSLSVWRDTGVKLNTAREGLDGVPIVHENDTDPTQKKYFLLIAGGRSDNTDGNGAFLSSAESVEVDYATGALQSVTGYFVNETQHMVLPHAFFPLVTNQGRNDPTFCPPAAQPPCQDLDGDGYYDWACASPDQMPCDCDDTDPEVHPGPPDERGRCTNGKDDDCDGLIDCADTADCADDPYCTASCPDEDGDGYTAAWCGGTDCCDNGTEQSLGCDPTTAPGINPGATEICGDGIDQNCDGIDDPCACDTDADGDGHVSIACGGDDCCDSGTEGNDFFSGQGTIGCNPTNANGIHPGAYDPCGDSVDQNCDGWDSLCRVYGGSMARQVRQHVAEGPMSVVPTARGRWADRVNRLPRPTHRALPKLYGSDPRVWVVAAQGLNSWSVAGNNNSGEKNFEACELLATWPPVAGALLTTCSSTADPTQWSLQGQGPPQFTFGHDAVVYGHDPNEPASYTCLFDLYGAASQTIGGGPSVINSASKRFPFDTNPSAPNLVILNNQAGAPAPITPRAYYQLVRLNGYIFIVGGHSGAAGLNSVERIQQQ
ncbi:MAG: hypothetical protein HY906_24540 [Deltaproteobacteria bacterium]|nr:hypothetical protein [Deltaproteobacteria bacterium]